jgi:NAD(P)-dependent dehydrogenase (short-subunit alcohol dehydrogenase family)
MDTITYKTALIVGAGVGLSAALTRLFTSKASALRWRRARPRSLARFANKPVPQPIHAMRPISSDVTKLFSDVERDCGAPDVVVYNASARVRGAFVDLVPADVAKAIAVSAFGGFLVAQQASRRMLPNRHGAILFTGASASVKGYAQSAAFAM